MSTIHAERSARQARTVSVLLDAALELLYERGHEALTVRDVAARAGVTHTTAYAYFTSKAHLAAELFAQRIHGLAMVTVDPGASFEDRVVAAVTGPAHVMAGEPALAAAVAAAMQSHEPEVDRLRTGIGQAIVERIRVSLGPDSTPEVVDALMLAFTGAMTMAGTGRSDFGGVVERMRSVARLLAGAPAS